MLVLDATSKSLRMVLGEAHTTNPVDFTVAYADATTTTFTEGGGPAQSNGTTNAELLAAPSASTQRVVKEITIFNNDTVSHAVTLYYRVTATDYVFYKETLAAGAWAYPLRDGVFEGSAAAAADMVLSEIQTVTGAKTFNSGKFILAGSSSGTTTVNATAAASGTLTLPAATDTLVGKATTDTLTNKELEAATVKTSLKPTTDNVAPLGDTTHQFSDLHLGNGAVISFDGGNEAITHDGLGWSIDGHINPAVDLSGGGLGSSLYRWDSLYVGSVYIKSTGILDFGASDAVITHSSNTLTLSGGDFVAPNITAQTAFLPDANDGAALGTTALQFSDVFLAEGGVINWDNGDATLTQSGNDVTLAGASLTARIKPRTGSTTSSATPTINTDDVEYYELTAQAADITSFTTNLSGTPVKGQNLWISITGTAARAITWGASFEASTVALPTTTVTTNRLDVGFKWNDVTSKWRCVAKA